MQLFDTYVIVDVKKAKDSEGTAIWEVQIGDGGLFTAIEGEYARPKRGDVLIISNTSRERFLLRSDDVSFAEYKDK